MGSVLHLLNEHVVVGYHFMTVRCHNHSCGYESKGISTVPAPAQMYKNILTYGFSSVDHLGSQ